jgi:transcriptional regulator with XRE-family HTH domain
MPTTFDRIAGMRLREVRERRGLTQRELAAALDVSTSLIAKWEKGRTSLSVARINQLARVLHVPPAALRTVPGSPLKRQEGEAATVS